MPEVGTPQPPPPTPEAVSTPVDDLDQNLEVPEAESPPEPVTETNDQPEAGKNQEASKQIPELEEDFVSEDAKKERAVQAEKIRREQVRTGLKSIFLVAESEEFNQEEITGLIEPWVERYVTNKENLSEVLKYLELAKNLISEKFPSDRRIEIVSSFAEVIAEGHMDAETLASLVPEVVPAEKAAEGQAEKDGYEGVAFFQNADGTQGTRIVLLDKFFQQKEDGRRVFNIPHMIKHEIGHGLVRYGELLTTDEMGAIVRKTKNPEQQENQEVPKISAEIRDILDQARRDQHLQTNHLATVLRALNELRQKTGVTEAQIQQREIMAANQIMAEKTGIFLSSNGEFGDFLRANIEVTSDDNLNNIFGRTDRAEIKEIIDKVVSTDGDGQQTQLAELRQECPELSRFLESNKVFFDLASERLHDKDQLKERIEKNIQNDTRLDDSEEDFFGYYDGGFYEPATPASSGTEKSNEQRSSWISLTLELADAFGKEVEGVTPVTELTKDR